ncbi:carbohydrate-binding protein [Streptomyces sp. NPDC055051]
MRTPRSARLSLAASIAVLAPLVPTTLVTTAATATAATPAVANPGFEQGSTGWNFTPGTGIAANNPHSGGKLAYLDGGSGRKVSQTITVSTAGSYDVTAWAAAGGTGGKFEVRVNGTLVRSVNLPAKAAYARYTAGQVAVKNGDAMEIAFLSGSSWVNVDDVTLTPSTPPAVPLVNPGFEQGSTGWNFTSGSGISTNLPHAGTKLAYLDGGSGKKVSQTVTVSTTGSYDFSAWIATGGTGGKFTARVNGTLAGSVALPSRSGYARYTVSRVAVNSGDRLELAFESGTNWINADDVMVSPSAPADPVATSSDPKVVALFDWAKRKANSWVMLPGTVGALNVDESRRSGTGEGAYGASYWAGYAHRSAYYSRDMAHQVAGASVLGLSEANKSMLRAFTASATPEHKYFPVWALNFDNQTYLSIDYGSPQSFVREVPATFELVEKANAAYRWTGDSAYVNDPEFWNYYRHATKEFIELHDGKKPNGVAEGTGNGIFAGAASYNEVGEEHLAESGDSIGSQYQAFRAMSALATSKGDSALAAEYKTKADDLKEYFNDTWSGTGSGSAMVRGYRTDGTALTGWGLENSWFMPMKQIMEPGSRTDAYLDYVDQQASGGGKPSNIEAISYLPDTFFAYDRNDTAWKWMQYVYDQRDVQHPVAKQGPNGDYPEVSYTLVSQTVEGLMGVQPDAPARSLATTPRLPSGMGWLQIKDIKVGGNTFTLRHDGTTKSTLTNSTGASSYAWEARFPGNHGTITVDGAARTAATKTVNGTTYSYVTVNVAPGATATAHVS